MRTIKLEFKGAHLFVTDWNFKTWNLTKNTDGTYRCSEINGVTFESAKIFVEALYGKEHLYDDNAKGVVFENYKVEVLK